MSSAKLPRWVPPFAVVAVIGGLLIFSAQRPTAPSGVPYVTSASEFSSTLTQAVGLSQDALIKLDQGKTLSDKERASLQKASDLYDVLHLYDPTVPGPFFGAGKIHEYFGRHEVAEALLRQAIYNSEARRATAPDGRSKAEYELIIADSRNERVKALVALSRYEEALKDADGAVKLQPGRAAYHAERAAALIGLKRYDEAAGEVAFALELEPENARARALRSLLRTESLPPS